MRAGASGPLTTKGRPSEENRPCLWCTSGRWLSDGYRRTAPPSRADLDLEAALVVLQMAVVHAEEQLPGGGHLHAVAAADHERRAVADPADQRARGGALRPARQARARPSCTPSAFAVGFPSPPILTSPVVLNVTHSPRRTVIPVGVHCICDETVMPCAGIVPVPATAVAHGRSVVGTRHHDARDIVRREVALTGSGAEGQAQRRRPPISMSCPVMFSPLFSISDLTATVELVPIRVGHVSHR